jgi:hypothetical protein
VSSDKARAVAKQMMLLLNPCSLCMTNTYSVQFFDRRIPSTALWSCYEPREKGHQKLSVPIILHKIERFGVDGAAVVSVADIGIRLYKHDPIEVTAERLVVEHTPGTAQPLRKIFSGHVSAPRMLEQQLHIFPLRRLFTDVENEVGFRRRRG